MAAITPFAVLDLFHVLKSLYGHTHVLQIISKKNQIN